MNSIEVRPANIHDDLTSFYSMGEIGLNWNRDLVFVAVDGEQIVGSIVVWDSEQPILFTGFFRIHEHYRDRMVGYRLMEMVELYAVAHNKVGIVGFTENERFAEHMEKLGLIVSEGMYWQLFKVTV